MPKYVAFLRAINVGGHTVKMDDLRRLFEGLSFTNVETFIASGNVIFDSTSKGAKTLERKIQDCLQKRLGYEVATFIRSTAVLYIGFLADEPGDEAKQKLESLRTESDDFHVSGREFYWLCRKKISESKVSGAAIAKALGGKTTLRNSTTVRKIAARFS
jgi:uncharacterized protein (DUF1697 family)